MPQVRVADLANALSEAGFEAADLRHVGDGWWSTCFAFDHADQGFVARVGNRREFFDKDAIAAAWRTGELPVPTVHAIRPYDDAWLCISDRAEGQPLESVGTEGFEELIPDLVAAFAALRRIEPVGPGWGEWDGRGAGRYPTWRAFVEAGFAASHDPEFRPADWRTRLDARLASVVDAAEARVGELNVDAAPRCVVHADLLHGNVHAEGGRLAGVFDWGAASYADPLYEAACLEFWEPWHADLELERFLERIGASAEPDSDDRRAACLIHIGVTHVAFTAARLADAADQAHQVADRLEDLVEL